MVNVWDKIGVAKWGVKEIEEIIKSTAHLDIAPANITNKFLDSLKKKKVKHSELKLVDVKVNEYIDRGVVFRVKYQDTDSKDLHEAYLYMYMNFEGDLYIR